MKVAIVGAGIAGLAYAWLAAERGHDVHVFERTRRAEGASIRNFGMFWPIAQPPGEARALAMTSRTRWETLAAEAGLWLNPCGSLHVAHDDDEWEALQQLGVLLQGEAFSPRLLSPTQVLEAAPVVNAHQLRGGLWSDAELGVNPPAALATIAAWLVERFSIRFSFETTVTKIEESISSIGQNVVVTNLNERYIVDHVVICSGADFATLFPQALQSAGIRRCKLQMMRTNVQPAGWRIGPHIASGLALRHYRHLQALPAIERCRARIEAESPELNRYGIHVLASQTDRGEVILGDSHEYDEPLPPFDNAEIDRFILRELEKVIQLPDWTIAARWHGVYAKHPELMEFQSEVLPGVHIRINTSGAGMTLSFGLAQRAWDEWEAV